MQENIQPQINSNQDDEISLKELILKLKEWWKYLLSKWKIIVIVGIIGGAFGLTYSFFKKPVYTGELTFALEEGKNAGGLNSALGFAAQLGIDFGGSSNGVFAGENLIELMKSRSMIESTLLSTIRIDKKELTLAEYYIDFNQLRKKWSEEEGLQKISFPANSNRVMFTRVQDSILNTITEALKLKSISVIKNDAKTNVIAVTCKSQDELFSKFFVEGLVKQVTDFYTKTKTDRSQKSVDVLQFKADSIRKELDKAMYGRAAFIDEALDLNPARQIASVPAQRKSIDIQVLSTAYGEVVKNLEISKMALMRDTPLIQIIDKPILPLEVEKIGKIKMLIIGGMLGSFLATFTLIFKKIIKDSVL